MSAATALPAPSTLRLAARLAARPGRLASASRRMGADLCKIAAGRSDRVPSRKDRRFADRAWQQNPALRRVLQTYLAAADALETLVADGSLEWRDEQRVRFLADNLVAALAPSNNPLLSPEAWKALIDTGGGSAISGVRNIVRDLRSAPRVPTMVEPDAFEVGKDLGITPGDVLLRTEMFELIRYRPLSTEVYDVPVLLVPPVINKFYIADLAPGRSMVEHLLGAGQQVFLVSWRNPDERHRNWGLDAYTAAVLEALGATRSLSGADRSHLFGVCSGGILSALAGAHLAATGRLDEVASLTLAVSVLDTERAGAASALADELTASVSVAASGRRGFLDGTALAELFAWLRPTDLVWNYWTNNYLLGRKPTPFDVLFWNSDTTRMPAALHRDFVDLALSNALTTPGAMTILGTPVDLGAITVPSYVVAGVADHISPWRSCYRSTGLLGGESRFVLSTSGHIASMVNPPGNPKASYRTSDRTPADPAEWERTAVTHDGSWWPDHAHWLAQRGGPLRAAVPVLPDALAAAPGEYVLAR